jgi:hypothetical protein
MDHQISFHFLHHRYYCREVSHIIALRYFMFALCLDVYVVFSLQALPCARLKGCTGESWCGMAILMPACGVALHIGRWPFWMRVIGWFTCCATFSLKKQCCMHLFLIVALEETFGRSRPNISFESKYFVAKVLGRNLSRMIHSLIQNVVFALMW